MKLEEGKLLEFEAEERRRLGRGMPLYTASGPRCSSNRNAQRVGRVLEIRGRYGVPRSLRWAGGSGTRELAMAANRYPGNT